MEPVGMIFLLNLEFMCAIYVPKDWRFSWIQSVVGCGAEVWLCGSVNRFCCDGNRFCGPVNRFCGGGNRFRGPVNRFCGGGNRFCGGGNRFLPTADWCNVDGNDWDRMEAALGPRGAKGALVAERVLWKQKKALWEQYATRSQPVWSAQYSLHCSPEIDAIEQSIGLIMW